MSKRKLDFRKLSNVKRRIECPPGRQRCPICIPVDWVEFNQLYFSNRPVVVECPSNVWGSGTTLMAMFGAMRMMRDRRNIGFFAHGEDVYSSGLANGFCETLMTGREHGSHYMKNTVVKEFDRLNFSLADDWMFFMNFSHGLLSQRGDEEYTENFMQILDSTNGFSSGPFTKDVYREYVPRFYGDSIPVRKKAVVLWDTSKRKDMLDGLKEKYSKSFVFIPYGREKELVDNWFENNETMLDPLFDIAIMDQGLDMRKILLYAATNHLYEFREWGRFNPEILEKCLSKDDIKELM